MAENENKKGLKHLGRRILAIDAADDLESLVWKDEKGKAQEITHSHALQKMIAKYNVKTVQLLRLNAVLFFIIAAAMLILATEATYTLYLLNKWDVVSRFLLTLPA